MSKIFITGVSGIGKTTLAKYIAQRMQIPFVNGSSTVLWEKYKISTHLQLLQMGINDPQKALNFQYELLTHRFEVSNEYEHFVSDRSPLDNAVYFLLQNSPSLSTEQTNVYIQKCWDYFNNTPDCQVIYLSHKTEARPIENDNKRITNTFFQDYVVGPIFEEFIEHTKDEFRNKKPGITANREETEKYPVVHTIKDWDWKERLRRVDLILS